MALNLASAPRSGVEYSIQGNSTSDTQNLPDAGPISADTSVSYLTLQDMTGALFSPTSTPIQVCSKKVGLNSPNTGSQTAKCTSFGGGASFPAAASDPESPNFILHRVDVRYTFSPLIPGTPFGLTLLPIPLCTSGGFNIKCTFHMQVSMRALDGE